MFRKDMKSVNTGTDSKVMDRTSSGSFKCKGESREKRDSSYYHFLPQGKLYLARLHNLQKSIISVIIHQMHYLNSGCNCLDVFSREVFRERSHSGTQQMGNMKPNHNMQDQNRS